MRVVAIVVTVCLAATGCIGQSGSSAHGGFSGAEAHWYDVAYKRCATGFKKAMENPSSRSLDFLMETPKEAHHQEAVDAGCRAAAKDARVATGSLYETTP